MGHAGNGTTRNKKAVSADGVIAVTARDTNDLQELNICCDCIGDSYLSSLIETDGERRRCDYCGERAKAVTLEALADYIEAAFEHMSMSV